MSVILFLVFAFVAVAAAINMVVQRHPINSAISLIVVMGSLAVLYLLLGAEFIAASQVIVYAGAIMVLFLFVIMLLNAGAERPGKDRSRLAKFAGIPIVAVFLGVIGFLIRRHYESADQPVEFGAFTGGGPADVGLPLFTTYLLPFFITSVLILIAIMGAVVLGRKELD
jgi:NADH-quinone oxidoreductase subunit J